MDTMPAASSDAGGRTGALASVLKLLRSFYGKLSIACVLFLCFLSYTLFANQSSMTYLPIPAPQASPGLGIARAESNISTSDTGAGPQRTAAQNWEANDFDKMAHNFHSTSDTGGVPQRTTAQNWEANDFDKMAHNFQQEAVNCAALFAGNKQEVEGAVAAAKTISDIVDGASKIEEVRAKSKNDAKKLDLLTMLEKRPGNFKKLTNQWYLNATKDCQWFKRTRGYITSSLTKEEENFPISFSMVVYKDIEMVERLFRSVYRPQNSYCIHVDSKSDPKFLAAVKAVVQCFSDDAVFLSSRRVDVKWGTYTVLEPELICMNDLWHKDEEGRDQSLKSHEKSETTNIEKRIVVNKKGSTRNTGRAKWKYFINLTGQEFPLKTNHELVKILTAYKGANNEEGTVKRANKDRWKTKPPHGITPTKGGVHTLLNRATVDYIIHSPIARDFIEWLKHTRVPDEALFASINYNPQLGIPGTYNGSDLESVISFTRYKEWYGKVCYSQQLVHAICILSTGDLKKLGESRAYFANKFFLHQDRIVIGCLEEKIFNDTRDEYLGRKIFETSFYAQQDFVINRVKG